jgi:transposase-like protein
MTKLDEAQREKVAKLYGESDVPIEIIRERFGVNVSTIRKIAKEKGFPPRERIKQWR